MKSHLHPLHSLSKGLIASLLASMAVILIFSSTSTLAVAQSNDGDSTSSSHLDLSSNECLKKLSDNDIVIASIAFIDGLNSSEQLKELVKRKPWGVGTPCLLYTSDAADE